MPDRKPKRKALIVGINEYKDREQGKFPKLRGAENDARDLRERLEDAESPEFNYEIHYLNGSNATCANIRRELSEIFWKTENRCDIALFYFSGHGKVVEWYDEGYIAPYDMLFDDPFVYGIKMSELRQVISKSPHKCTITILDCCYSGLATRDKGDYDLMAKINKHIEDFAIEDFVGKGRIILTSSGEDQKSREIDVVHEFAVEHPDENKLHPHGAFTYSLLEGIDNGKTTLSELKTYVDEKIRDLSERTSDLKKQQCNFLASGCGDLEKTVIARSHEEKNKEKIENCIEKAEYLYKSHKRLLLINAVDQIQNALKINPKNQKALAVKEEINQALKRCRSDVYSWIQENTVNSSMYILDNFPILEDLAQKVSFEGISSFSENSLDKVLLIDLCRVSAREIDNIQFEEKIRQYLSPRSTLLGQNECLEVPKKLSRNIQFPESSFPTPDSPDTRLLEFKTGEKSLKSNNTFINSEGGLL